MFDTTSNGKQYLKKMVANYADDDFYLEDLAVADRRIITASGLGSVEFGREIIKQLNLYNDADTEIWFDMFKHGVLPTETPAAANSPLTIRHNGELPYDSKIPPAQPYSTPWSAVTCYRFGHWSTFARKQFLTIAAVLSQTCVHYHCPHA